MEDWEEQDEGEKANLKVHYWADLHYGQQISIPEGQLQETIQRVP